MALKNQVAVDARLMYDHQTQILTEGSNQVSAREIVSTQVSNNVISFDNLLSIGENSVIDPNVVIEYTVQIAGSTINADIYTPPGVQTTYGAGVNSTWARATSAITTATRIDTATLINNPNAVFSQYPLSSVCNNLSVSINNVNTTINLSSVVAVMRENLLSDEKRNQIGSMCPCDLNRSPALLPQNTVASPFSNVNQPNTPVEESNQRSRLCVDVLGDVAGRLVTYTIREPVFIAPFQLSKNAHGLCSVNSLSVRFQLDASKGLQGMFNTTPDVPDNFVAGQTITITGAKLILNYLSVDVVEHPIPSVSYYDYSAHEVNLSKIPASAVLFSKATQSLACNAFKLTTIPKFYWVKLAPSTTAIESRNLMAGFPISTLQINYGSYGIYVFNRTQLWVAYCRNTQQTNLSYHQWVALGTPICLQPSLDMSSASSFAGVDGIGGLMWQSTITFSMSNYADAGVAQAEAKFDVATCNAIEIYVMQGSLAIGNGSAVFKNSTVNMATFDELGANRIAVSDAAVANSQGSGESGGGFGWGSVKGLLSSGAKSLGKLAIKHAPDLAKAGAEYGLGKLQQHLDGGELGESAGGMGVSAGRYSRRR